VASFIPDPPDGAGEPRENQLELFFALGATDYLWQKRQWTESLRMTKQEVKDEFKQTEGNPHMKAAIRGRQAKISRLRMPEGGVTANEI